MASISKPQRVSPSWSVTSQPLDPADEHSYRLQVQNRGGMVGSFTPLALQSNGSPDQEFSRLELRALPGSETSSLVNPGESLFFELIAEPGKPIPKDEAVVLEILYAAISPQTDEWYSKDRDSAVLSLSILISSSAGDSH